MYRLLLVFLVLASCGREEDDGFGYYVPPEAFDVIADVTGTWVGRLGPESTVRYVLTQHSDDTVTGTVRWIMPGLQASGEVDGRNRNQRSVYLDAPILVTLDSIEAKMRSSVNFKGIAHQRVNFYGDIAFAGGEIPAGTDEHGRAIRVRLLPFSTNLHLTR